KKKSPRGERYVPHGKTARATLDLPAVASAFAMSRPATLGSQDALWMAFRPRASTLHCCPLLEHSSPVRRALAERRSEPTEIEPHATRATGLRRMHTARSLDVPSTLTDVPL